MTSVGANADRSPSMAAGTTESGHGFRTVNAARRFMRNCQQAGATMNKLLLGWVNWAVTRSAWYAIALCFGYLLGRALLGGDM